MENLGVGHVERSTVVSITTLSKERSCLQQKTGIRLSVVAKSQASSKKTIVPGVIQDIVPNDGMPKLFLFGFTIKLANLLWVPFRNLSRFYSSRPAFQDSLPSLLTHYRGTPFTLQDGLCEWKGEGGLLFLHRQDMLLGMLQLKKLTSSYELSSFVLHPHIQGVGYGKHMLKETVTHLDSPVWLRVKQENPAQMLYKQIGFQTIAYANGRYIMKYSK